MTRIDVLAAPDPSVEHTLFQPLFDSAGVNDTVNAAGYVRMTTNEQAVHGASLTAERTAIAECEGRGWNLVDIYADEGAGAKTLRKPQLDAVLERGDAQVLVVARLDRLSRSMLDFATLLERARRRAWRIDLIDLGIDLPHPTARWSPT